MMSLSPQPWAVLRFLSGYNIRLNLLNYPPTGFLYIFVTSYTAVCLEAVVSIEGIARVSLELFSEVGKCHYVKRNLLPVWRQVIVNVHVCCPNTVFVNFVIISCRHCCRCNWRELHLLTSVGVDWGDQLSSRGKIFVWVEKSCYLFWNTV